MAPASPRLLIVDDNEDNRYTLSLLLELDGYQSTNMAVDGREALEKLGTEDFDLVLLDVMMPEVNGYQVLEHLKAEGRLGNPPVLMISALDEIDSVVKCIELGAVDYLPKPFEPILLRARVKATLERKVLEDEVRRHRDRMQAELVEAREVQMSLSPCVFPDPTDDRPVEIFGHLEPAREVGGDFYDFFYRDDGSLCVVVGDVAGKGAPAALFAARARDIIRMEGLRLDDPAEIVEAANAMLAAANPAMTFVTLLVGVLAVHSGKLRYTNAGHDNPFHCGTRGIVALADAKGPPAGIDADFRYATAETVLAPGDLLFLFTDGITEALDRGGGLYSDERLSQALGDLWMRSPRAATEAVLGEVYKFAEGAEPADDITVLALRRVEVS
jgi:sigma-B regulation protein RsbU (phosphoserine phosphatase)